MYSTLKSFKGLIWSFNGSDYQSHTDHPNGAKFWKEDTAFFMEEELPTLKYKWQIFGKYWCIYTKLRSVFSYFILDY
jgi:hypothetical protein